MGKLVGYCSFIIFWMSFEWIHLNWELSWPWLTLGNVFATHPNWVQWYEISGSSGGSLWVLLVNLFIFLSLSNQQELKRINKKYIIGLLCVLLIPFGISYFLLKSEEHRELRNASATHKNIVSVQPNVDPWNEKFAAGKQEAQVHHLISLSESKIDSQTALVIWPETAIPVAIDEDSMKRNYFMAPVWDFLKKNPGITLLAGIEGFRFYPENRKTFYSVRVPGTNLYAESYNSAVVMDSDDFKIYHKSKFVPGAETLPSFLHFLSAWFEEFGGTTGSYVGQNDRTVLKTYNNAYAVAPSVCYESVYGEFMAEYIRRGANIIAVITNDGWWGNTPGYRQHENYARLRAIETRRWVIRSANTGISCFIDPLGHVIDPQPWDKATAIKFSVPISEGLSFFVQHGDILSRCILLATLILVIWNIFIILKKKFRRG